MILIAHRGNINGRCPEKENCPEYIDEAIAAGFDVEIDVWCFGGNLYLGHDAPTYCVCIDAILERKERLWCHAKNIDALAVLLKNDIHVFSHDTDQVVLTSKLYMWVYPGCPLIEGCIAVMPERAAYSRTELLECAGVCSDFPKEIQELVEVCRDT